MKYLIPLLFTVLLCACNPKDERTEADMILTNALVYTVDSTFSKTEAFAIKDGKFLEVGTTENINSKFKSKKNSGCRW